MIQMIFQKIFHFKEHNNGMFLDIVEDKGIEALDFVIDKITASKYFDGFQISDKNF